MTSHKDDAPDIHSTSIYDSSISYYKKALPSVTKKKGNMQMEDNGTLRY